jgi:nucleoside triphosphatase
MADQVFPEPTVGALIVDPDGRVLLTKSHKWRDRYVIPGGHIELGETMEQALRREVAEETGLAIRDVELLLHQEFIYDASFFKPGHYIFFDFCCRTDSTEVVLNDEAESYVWLTPEEALGEACDIYTKRTIHAYLARRPVEGGRNKRG